VQTRAYSICRRCAAVFPDGRRCPICDGDRDAARAVAAATAHAIEAAPDRRPVLRARPTALIAVTVLLGLVLALGVAAAAAIATPGADDAAGSGSGSGSGGALEVSDQVVDDAPHGVLEGLAPQLRQVPHVERAAGDLDLGAVGQE
jgi:hypothetical protein